MTPVKWIIRETIFVFFLCMIWLGTQVWIKVGLTVALFSCELHDICTHMLNGKNKKPEYIVKQYVGLKFKDKCPHCGGELSARFVKEGGEASGQG